MNSQLSTAIGSVIPVDILYKYVTAERAITCIPEVGDGTLRATQPASLNDPFECAVIPLYSTIVDETKTYEKLAKALTEFNASCPVTAKMVRREREKSGSLFARELVAHQVSKRFGIVSFATEHLHPLMWSHYTIDGSGFVVGYDRADLKSLASMKGYLLQPVTYGDMPPPVLDPSVPISPESNITNLLSRKSKHWCYEKEWRLLVELKETIGTGERDRHNQPITLVQIPNEAVVSVYYTERTPPESVALIRGRLADKNNRYRAVSPRKLILSTTSYGYEVDVADSEP